jgi:FAD synthase
MRGPRPTALRLAGLRPRAWLARRGGVVLTFGVFDGLLPGQVGILEAVRDRAAEIDAVPAAIVFRPLPAELTQGLRRPYLMPRDATVAAIRLLGIDQAGHLHFTRALADLQAPDFLTLLAARLPIRELWLGARASVGRGPLGSLPSVREVGARLGFEVHPFELATAGRGIEPAARQEGPVDPVRRLGRRFRLPVHVHDASSSAVPALARYWLTTPARLLLPPDGHYAARATPAAFGGMAPPAHARPGPAVLSVLTDRVTGAPALSLLAPCDLGWRGCFLSLQLARSFALPPGDGELWAWAAAAVPGDEEPRAEVVAAGQPEAPAELLRRFVASGHVYGLDRPPA